MNVDAADAQSIALRNQTKQNKISNANLPIQSENVESRVMKNVESFKSILNESLKKFVIKLYDNLSVPRSIIQMIVDAVDTFLSSGIIVILKLCS